MCVEPNSDKSLTAKFLSEEMMLQAKMHETPTVRMIYSGGPHGPRAVVCPPLIFCIDWLMISAFISL